MYIQYTCTCKYVHIHVLVHVLWQRVTKCPVICTITFNFPCRGVGLRCGSQECELLRLYSLVISANLSQHAAGALCGHARVGALCAGLWAGGGGSSGGSLKLDRYS